MKQLLIAIAFLANTFTTTVTPWTSLTSNQGVTKVAFENQTLVDGVLWNLTGHTFAQTNQLITKDSLSAYASSLLNTALPRYLSKTGSQVITRGDITYAMIVSTAHGTAGCSPYSGSQTLFTDTGLTRFYTDAAMTTPFSGSGEYYWIDAYGISLSINSSGYTINIAAC